MNLPYEVYPRVLAVIEAISLGKTESAACDENYLSVTTFKKYIANDVQLQELYTEADQRGADALAEALLNIDNHRVIGRSDPKMAKVISDNIKWFLAKRKPKQYGDKIQVEHNITMDRAITDALLAGRGRVAMIESQQVIDVTPVQVEDDEEILKEILS